MKKKIYTTDMFIDDLKKINADVNVLGECNSFYDDILVEHTCGHKWMTKPHNMIKLKTGCPMCNHSVKKTHDLFVKDVKNLDDNIEVIGEYKSCKEKIKIRYKDCGHEYEMQPSSILGGYKCPYCSGRKLLVGFNDIMTTNPWMATYFVNKEDAYKYMSCSNFKVLCKCPDCGKEELKTINNIYYHGYNCSQCADGISFPNKFGRAMLSQLPVENVVYEYLPEWSHGKKYDNYFEHNGKQYILEMDGGFHFKNTSITNVDDVKANDVLKDELAKQHNIIMIRIDCNEANKEYIVKHIYDSLLNELFNLDIIDWNECEKTASTSMVKTICLYFEEHKFEESAIDIAEHFKISISTLHRYRKTGERVGWCTYDRDEKKKRYAIHVGKSVTKPVDVYDNNNNLIKNFDSCKLCSQYMTEKYQIEFYENTVRSRCSSHKSYHGFYFKYSDNN